MAKAGRPRVLDDIKRREVCALVSTGCGIGDAAQYVGCSPATIRREALRNIDFHEALRRAELGAKLKPLQTLQKAAATHWRAAAWLLERTSPDQFARCDAKSLKHNEVEEIVCGLVEAIVTEINDPEVRQRVYRRLLALTNDLHRQASAAERPRRDPRRVSKQATEGRSAPASFPGS